MYITSVMATLMHVLTWLILYVSCTRGICFIHQTVNDSNIDSWKLNFTLFVEQFEGVILSHIDSNKNQFDIAVKKESNRIKSTSIRYNDLSKRVYTKDLCGCDSCGNMLMYFNIQLQDDVLNIECNHHANTQLYGLSRSTKVSINRRNMNATTNVNVRNKIQIMIGNDILNRRVSNLRGQLTGCLESFYYYEKRITFETKGNKILSTCPHMCQNTTCNHGLCHENRMRSPTCDCLNIALNGKYCNESLRMYNKFDINSYNMTDRKNELIKFTWKQRLYKDYCLLEISDNSIHHIIWLAKDRLMIDNITVDTINRDGINFVTVLFTDHHFVITIHNNTTGPRFLLNKCTLINIGFTDKTSICDTFDGEYDINFNGSKLRPRQQVAKVESTIIVKMSTPFLVSTSSPKHNIYTLGGFGLSISLMAALYYIFCRKQEAEMARLVAIVDSLSGQPNVFFTEPGVYDIVIDNDDYEIVI